MRYFKHKIHGILVWQINDRTAYVQQRDIDDTIYWRDMKRFPKWYEHGDFSRVIEMTEEEFFLEML